MLIDAYLFERNNGKPQKTTIQADIISSIVSVTDYVPRVTVRFPYYPDYRPSRGDVLAGMGGWDDAWNLLDSFLSQDQTGFQPIVLNKINASDDSFEFVPAPFFDSQTSKEVRYVTYHTMSVSNLDIINRGLGATQYNVLNVFKDFINNFITGDSYLDIDADLSFLQVDPYFKESVPVTYQITVDKNQDATSKATVQTYSATDEYIKLCKGLSSVRPMYCYPYLYFAKPTLPIQDRTHSWPVDIYTLNPSEITAEAYKNDSSKINVVYAVSNEQGSKVETTEKRKIVIGYTKTGKAKTKNQTIKHEQVTPAKYQTIGAVAKSYQRGIMTAPVDSKGFTTFPVKQAAVPNIKTVEVDPSTGQSWITQVAASLDSVIDADATNLTIKGNILNSWLNWSSHQKED